MKSDIKAKVQEFQKIAFPDHRYSSFDYCYNYFFKIDSQQVNSDIEKACAFLGFYLASWGMFRGSSFLLQKSYKYFIPVVNYISEIEPSIWDYKPSDYLEERKRKKVIKIYEDIKEKVIEDDNQAKTLVTKIMLGTIGIVPAYDEYFCKTFKKVDPKVSKFSVFNEDSLIVLGNFYQKNQKEIDQLSKKIKTKRFEDDSEYLQYPQAKIIDMYGFANGIND